MANEPTIIYRLHATLRMVERGISPSEVEQTIANGETIASYPDDKPYPSLLMLAIIDGRPLHTVVAWNADENEWIVITVYEPNPADWEPDFKTKKKT